MVLFFTAVGTGCAVNATSRGSAGNEAPNLVSNHRLPARQIGAHYSAALWEGLSRQDYAGYVVVEGEVSGEEFVTRRFRESYPDNSRNVEAVGLLRDVRIRPATVGTHAIPQAVAYVIFYEKSIFGDLVLVYAEQTNFSVPGMNGGASYFIARRH